MTENETLLNVSFSPELLAKTAKFIVNFEGCRLQAYKPTPNDVWTIGFGHTKGVKQGDKITFEQAQRLLLEDLKTYISALQSVKVPLSDNEKIALISFVYNVGISAFKSSTLLRKLNLNDKQAAALEFDKWIYQKGIVLKGLKNRRSEEKKMFLGCFQ